MEAKEIYDGGIKSLTERNSNHGNSLYENVYNTQENTKLERIAWNKLDVQELIKKQGKHKDETLT